MHAKMVNSRSRYSAEDQRLYSHTLILYISFLSFFFLFIIFGQNRCYSVLAYFLITSSSPSLLQTFPFCSPLLKTHGLPHIMAFLWEAWMRLGKHMFPTWYLLLCVQILHKISPCLTYLFCSHVCL